MCKTLRGSLLRRRRKECFKDRKSKDGYKITVISDVVSAIKDFKAGHEKGHVKGTSMEGVSTEYD